MLHSIRLNLKRYAKALWERSHNTVLLNRKITPFTPSDSIIFNNIHTQSLDKSDIEDHLKKIFAECIKTRPELIVELGVRGGESTIVFEQIAPQFNSHIISVDIEPSSYKSEYKNWHFIASDDILFANTFAQFCEKASIKKEIDLLFIDTSHKYAHTVKEIKYWFPHLSSNAKVLFHDTNMGQFSKKLSGCIQSSWDNKRGVIRAIEEYLETTYNEKISFIDYRKGWLISHFPECNGFTVMEKIPLKA